MAKNILLFCCNGFETMEFAPFVDVMGWARNDYGCEVNVVTCGFTKTVKSTFDIPIIMDKTFYEINVADYDALAIPGGFEEWLRWRASYRKKRSSSWTKRNNLSLAGRLSPKAACGIRSERYSESKACRGQKYSHKFWTRDCR